MGGRCVGGALRGRVSRGFPAAFQGRRLGRRRVDSLAADRGRARARPLGRDRAGRRGVPSCRLAAAGTALHRSPDEPVVVGRSHRLGRVARGAFREGQAHGPAARGAAAGCAAEPGDSRRPPGQRALRAGPGSRDHRLRSLLPLRRLRVGGRGRRRAHVVRRRRLDPRRGRTRRGVSAAAPASARLPDRDRRDRPNFPQQPRDEDPYLAPVELALELATGRRP